MKNAQTKRWIGLIIGATIFLILNWVATSAYVNKQRHESSEYRVALKTRSPRRFNYIVDSQQGKVIANGKFKALEPTKFSEMNHKKYLAVKKDRYDYTMHTTTTTDSKGHTSTHTYWSWDFTGSQSSKSPHLKFMGRKYKTSKFSVDQLYQHVSAYKLIKDCDGYYYYTGPMTRYSYSVVPSNTKGTFLANAGSKGLRPISGSKIKISQSGLKQFVKEHEQLSIWTIVAINIIALIFESGILWWLWLKEGGFIREKYYW